MKIAERDQLKLCDEEEMEEENEKRVVIASCALSMVSQLRLQV